MKNLLSSIIFYGFVSLLYCNYIELIISKNRKEEKRTKKKPFVGQPNGMVQVSFTCPVLSLMFIKTLETYNTHVSTLHQHKRRKLKIRCRVPFGHRSGLWGPISYCHCLATFSTERWITSKTFSWPNKGRFIRHCICQKTKLYKIIAFVDFSGLFVYPIMSLKTNCPWASHKITPV